MSCFSPRRALGRVVAVSTPFSNPRKPTTSRSEWLEGCSGATSTVEQARGGLHPARTSPSPHRAEIRDKAPPARDHRNLGDREARAEGSGPTRGGPLGRLELGFPRCRRIWRTTGGSVRKERILILSPHEQSIGSTSNTLRISCAHEIRRRFFQPSGSSSSLGSAVGSSELSQSSAASRRRLPLAAFE